MFRTQVFSQDDSTTSNLEKVIIRNLLRKDLEEPGEVNKYLEIKLVYFKADVYISFSASLKTHSDIVFSSSYCITTMFSVISKASQMLGAKPESD